MAKPKVLIVEDDDLLADVYNASLSAEGIKVDVCGNYSEAIEVYDPKSHRLVILDVLLPGKNGFELLKAMRRKPRSNHTNIIVITGMNTDELNFNNEIMVGLNIIGICTKSQFSIAQLVALVKKELN